MAYKIGIDFHGVISAYPREFAAFCREIKLRGVQVHIISGGEKEDVASFLARYNVEYDEIWTILDYCAEQGIQVMYDADGFHVPTDVWDKAKAFYCARERINFHIDDSCIYGQYFVTPYCQYNICNGHCSLDGGLEVDFTKPSQAADVIADYIMTQTKS